MEAIELIIGCNIYNTTPEQRLIFKEALSRVNEQRELAGSPIFLINGFQELALSIFPDIAVASKHQLCSQSSSSDSLSGYDNDLSTANTMTHDLIQTTSDIPNHPIVDLTGVDMTNENTDNPQSQNRIDITSMDISMATNEQLNINDGNNNTLGLNTASLVREHHNIMTCLITKTPIKDPLCDSDKQT